MNLKNCDFLHLSLVAGSLFLYSCASSGAPLAETSPSGTPSSKPKAVAKYYEEEEISAPTLTENSQGKKSISSKGYSFEMPEGDWSVIGGEFGLPFEFYNAKTGRRALLREIELEQNEPIQLMDRARIEMQSQEAGGKAPTFSEIAPMEAFDATGVFFDMAAKRYDTPFEICGMVINEGNRIYTLTMNATENVPEQGELKKEWEEFFKDFKLVKSEKDNLPDLDPTVLNSYESTDLGYSWSVKDTVWHFWNTIARQNPDPDLVLSNKAEDLSMFIYGAMVDPDEVSQNDLFKVMMVRLGISPKNPTLDMRRMRGDSHMQTFTLTHVVNGFDFEYEGRFYYENGRGILAVTWTQGVNRNKYEKIMERALDGLKIGKAPALSNDAKQKKFNAAVVSQVGILRLMDEQPLVALSYFERANKMDPTEPLYLINCGYVYQIKELYGPGISHFESQMDLVRKNGKLLSILGEMYEGVFDYGRAREYAEAALQYTPNNPEYVINLSDALWGLGQRTQSLVVVQRLYDTQPSSRLGVYLAKTYMGLDQFAEAVEVLYSVRGRFGMSKDVGEALMDALSFLGRFDEARAISEETLAKDKSDHKIWTKRGKILFYSKNFREAEKSLTKAISLKPDDEDAKSFLSATKAFLGKADNRTLQKPIAPVEERTSDLKKLLNSEAKTEAVDGDFPAVVHYRKEMLKAPKNEPWVRSEEMLMEILDVRGAAIYREFTFDFLPGFDRIYLNALEVYDSNWKLKEKATLNGAYITYATEIGGENESQTAHFPLQELAPGDFVYLQFSRTAIENKGSIPYSEFVSSKDVPVGEASFKFYGDTSKIVAEVYGPLEVEGFNGGKEWKIFNPVVIRKEMYMPVYRDFGAGFLLTGKEEWNAIGNDYQNLIKHQFKQAVAVREKAFEVKGSRLGEEAVQAIIDFVRHDIRYREIRFGGHSLIPQKSEVTLKEHRGDCKDHALLLKEMLEAIGIKSYLVAIHLTDAGFESLPAIQQFNHMIVYIPAQGKIKEKWVDATDKTGNDRPVPLDMEGKVALVIDGEESHVVTTPILEDDQEHRINIDHRLFIGSDGLSEFRDSLTLHGKFASSIRNLFYGKETKKQEELLEEFMSAGIPDVNISKIKIENLDDFSKPLILVSTYASKAYFGQGGSELKGRFPNVWERSLFKLPKVNKRHHPIRMPHETQFSYTLQVKAPKGKTAYVTGPKEFGRTPDYVSFEKGANGENSIKWTTFALYADPTEYEKIREEWNYLLSETNPMIIIK